MDLLAGGVDEDLYNNLCENETVLNNGGSFFETPVLISASFSSLVTACGSGSNNLINSTNCGVVSLLPTYSYSCAIYSGSTYSESTYYKNYAEKLVECIKDSTFESGSNSYYLSSYSIEYSDTDRYYNVILNWTTKS